MSEEKLEGYGDYRLPNGVDVRELPNVILIQAVKDRAVGKSDSAVLARELARRIEGQIPKAWWDRLRAEIKAQQKPSNDSSFDEGWRCGARAIEMELDRIERGE